MRFQVNKGSVFIPTIHDVICLQIKKIFAVMLFSFHQDVPELTEIWLNSSENIYFGDISHSRY
jgi:hypothetical protein